MHGETMKDEHVAGIDLTASPFVSQRSSFGNRRYVRLIMILKTKTMRAFQNAQGALIDRAVVERNPRSKTLRITIHESIVLMCVDYKALAVGKDQSPDRFWMNQKPFAHELAHHLFKGRMVSESVKGFEVEDLLVGPLERWIGIAAGRSWISHALTRSMIRQKPARSSKSLRYLASY